MKKGLTEMVFILDKSGSMEYLTDDTIGGFNSMIEQQKLEDGEAYVTTVLFSSNHRTLHNHVNVQEVQPITRKDYCAYGMTALLDAIGDTIDSIGERLSNTPEDERPEKVVFVITTDGYENDSRRFTKSKIKEMIQHQQEKYSWIFMFLGANIDAVGEAESLGIDTKFSKTYTASDVGTQSVYKAVADTLSYTRSVDLATDGDWTAQACCFMDSIV